MTEEVAKIKANKDGTYIDIVPEKCVSAQKAQYDENGRDLLDAESSQTIKGANTFAAKQTFTGGTAVSGTSAIAGNVNMDSGAVAIGSAVTVENHGKITADNTANVLKAANHDSVLTSNDVLTAKDINEVNGKANNLLHRSGGEAETITSRKNFISESFQIEMADGQTECRQYMKINLAREDTTSINQVMLILRDCNDLDWGFLQFIKFDDGRRTMQMTFLDNSGNQHAKTLFAIDKDGNIIG